MSKHYRNLSIDNLKLSSIQNIKNLDDEDINLITKEDFKDETLNNLRVVRNEDEVKDLEDEASRKNYILNNILYNNDLEAVIEPTPEISEYNGTVYDVENLNELNNALSNVEDGDIISLKEDIENLTSQLVINKNIKITSDGSRKKISSSSVVTFISVTSSCTFDNIILENSTSNSIASVLSINGESSNIYLLGLVIRTNEFGIVHNGSSLIIKGVEFNFVGTANSHRYIHIQKLKDTKCIIDSCLFQGNGANSSQCILLRHNNQDTPDVIDNSLIVVKNCTNVSSAAPVQRLMMIDSQTGDNMKYQFSHNDMSTAADYIVFYQQNALQGVDYILLNHNFESRPNNLLPEENPDNAGKGIIGIDWADGTGTINTDVKIYARDNINFLLRPEYLNLTVLDYEFPIVGYRGTDKFTSHDPNNKLSVWLYPYLDIVDKQTLNKALENINVEGEGITQAQLNEALEDYVTETQLNQALENIDSGITEAQLDEKLEDYTLSNQLPDFNLFKIDNTIEEITLDSNYKDITLLQDIPEKSTSLLNFDVLSRNTVGENYYSINSIVVSRDESTPTIELDDKNEIVNNNENEIDVSALIEDGDLKLRLQPNLAGNLHKWKISYKVFKTLINNFIDPLPYEPDYFNPTIYNSFTNEETNKIVSLQLPFIINGTQPYTFSYDIKFNLPMTEIDVITSWIYGSANGLDFNNTIRHAHGTSQTLQPLFSVRFDEYNCAGMTGRNINEFDRFFRIISSFDPNRDPTIQVYIDGGSLRENNNNPSTANLEYFVLFRNTNTGNSLFDDGNNVTIKNIRLFNGVALDGNEVQNLVNNPLYQ